MNCIAKYNGHNIDIIVQFEAWAEVDQNNPEQRFNGLTEFMKLLLSDRYIYITDQNYK